MAQFDRDTSFLARGRAMSSPTIIVATPDVDGVASAVIAARAAGGGGDADTVFCESADLADFLTAGERRQLPRPCDLILCGLEVVHTTWDGRLVRPQLVRALRGLVGTKHWFSVRSWTAEDRAAVHGIVGGGRLVVSDSAACAAALVRDCLAAPGDHYAELMVAFASGQLPEQADEEWGADWRRVVAWRKGDPDRLKEAVAPLMDGHPERLDEGLKQGAREQDARNRRFAADHSGEPLPVGERKLVVIDVPPEMHAFWREISDGARAETGADFCLCHLTGRPVLLLTRGPEQQIDLRRWARYLTDMLPGAQAVGAQPDAVPVFVQFLAGDPGLRQEAVRFLQEGAHLLSQ